MGSDQRRPPFRTSASVYVFAGSLGKLLLEAARARRLREAGRHDPKCGGGAGGVAGDLESAFDNVSGPAVEMASGLNALATAHQLHSAAIRTMHTCIDRQILRGVAARAVAAAFSEVVYFLETGVPPDGCVDLYLAAGIQEDRLIVALGVRGDFSVVASADGTHALLRAARLVEALGGEFCRGVEPDRMVFAMTFPVTSVRIGGARRSRRMPPPAPE